MIKSGIKFKIPSFKSKKNSAPDLIPSPNHLALASPKKELEIGIPSTYAEKEAASVVVQEASTFRPSNPSTTDKALAATNIIIQTLGYFAGAVPIPGIKGVLQLVQSILGHIQNFKTNNAELEDLIRQICFLLVNINTQARGLNDEEIASTTKFKDVIEQFSTHLQQIERICIDLSNPSGDFLAVLTADRVKTDIARIRSEIDLAFKTFCITSMTFLNDFLAAWKKENKDDMTTIISALLRNAAADTKAGKNEVDTGPEIEITNNLNANKGTITGLEGGFNSNNISQASPDSSNMIWAAISGMKAGKIKYIGNDNSNSGDIKNLSGGFNSNNRTYTTQNGANYYGSYKSNNGNGNTGSNSIIIAGNSKKTVRMRMIGN